MAGNLKTDGKIIQTKIASSKAVVGSLFIVATALMSLPKKFAVCKLFHFLSSVWTTERRLSIKGYPMAGTARIQAPPNG
jgi:hypothetical protein